MHRPVPVCLLLVLLAALAVPAWAEEPAEEAQDPKTYTVSCKLFRKRAYSAGDGSSQVMVETLTTVLPDLTTLEGTRGELVSGYKRDTSTTSALYGFVLHAELRRVADGVVRADLLVSDDQNLGSGVHTASQRVARRLPLGQTLRIDLDRDEHTGAWVELTVRETVGE